MSKTVKNELIKIAYENPDLRGELLPLIMGIGGLKKTKTANDKFKKFLDALAKDIDSRGSQSLESVLRDKKNFFEPEFHHMTEEKAQEWIKKYPEYYGDFKNAEDFQDAWEEAKKKYRQLNDDYTYPDTALYLFNKRIEDKSEYVKKFSRAANGDSEAISDLKEDSILKGVLNEGRGPGLFYRWEKEDWTTLLNLIKKDRGLSKYLHEKMTIEQGVKKYKEEIAKMDEKHKGWFNREIQEAAGYEDISRDLEDLFPQWGFSDFANLKDELTRQGIKLS